MGLLVFLGTGLGLAERSWFLYQIENGRGDGSCGFMLGAPDWFPIDRWLPGIFEVRNLCSFTPDVLFGISMAEALLIVSAIGNRLSLWPRCWQAFDRCVGLIFCAEIFSQIIQSG